MKATVHLSPQYPQKLGDAQACVDIAVIPRVGDDLDVEYYIVHQRKRLRGRVVAIVHCIIEQKETESRIKMNPHTCEIHIAGIPVTNLLDSMVMVHGEWYSLTQNHRAKTCAHCRTAIPAGDQHYAGPAGTNLILCSVCGPELSRES